jgi:DNA-binding MarR family transcriptional regulator/GNAT superfamily N-acetyltransferase
MSNELNGAVSEIRAFNRFYTRQIGILSEGQLGSPFSLTEVRVLYELAHRGTPTAAALGQDLGLDAGYLSRILAKFESSGFLMRERSESDRRQHELQLTEAGRNAFQPLDHGASRQVETMIRRLSETDRERLVNSMKTIARLLGAEAGRGDFSIRTHRPGDIGWVTYRHGVLYKQEYGWDERFEALVADIAAKFIVNFDQQRERCWIAEREGERVGSVFLVKQSDEIAKLRLLLVEPEARGLGVGGRLVDECVRFAREARYNKITLWTQPELVAARRIYQNAGFQLVQEEPHRAFGIDMVGQIWEMTL